ncbi:hypothetical protein, partial [Lentzea sp. NPDC060358]|uniref:hypothetical protein n=1 Tax=Lentzea sp. NPDC060358 TaxID=3347103 RepID=UPI0036489951
MESCPVFAWFALCDDSFTQVGMSGHARNVMVSCPDGPQIIVESAGTGRIETKAGEEPGTHKGLGGGCGEVLGLVQEAFDGVAVAEQRVAVGLLV